MANISPNSSDFNHDYWAPHLGMILGTIISKKAPKSAHTHTHMCIHHLGDDKNSPFFFLRNKNQGQHDQLPIPPSYLIFQAHQPRHVCCFRMASTGWLGAWMTWSTSQDIASVRQRWNRPWWHIARWQKLRWWAFPMRLKVGSVGEWRNQRRMVEGYEGYSIYEGYEGYEGVFLVMNVERMNICFWKTLEKHVGFRSGVFLLDVLGCWFHFLFKGFQLRMYTRWTFLFANSNSGNKGV